MGKFVCKGCSQYYAHEVSEKDTSIVLCCNHQQVVTACARHTNHLHLRLRGRHSSVSLSLTLFLFLFSNRPLGVTVNGSYQFLPPFLRPYLCTPAHMILQELRLGRYENRCSAARKESHQSRFTQSRPDIKSMQLFMQSLHFSSEPMYANT